MMKTLRNILSIAAMVSALVPFSVLAQPYTLKYSYFSGGVPVAMEGNLAAVTNKLAPGTVLLVNTDTGQVLQTFPNPNPATQGTVPTDFYANESKSTVAYRNGLVLVGAEGEDLAASESGAAYLFDAATGNLLFTFTHPEPVPDFGGVGFGQGFGREVALTDDYALIASVAREAFLFDVNTGALVDRFPGPTPGLFGYAESVAMTDQYLAVSETGYSDGAASTGAVHVFDTATGNLLNTFYNPTPEAFDFFGEEIAISGDYLLVGAGQVDAPGLNLSGEAYLYDLLSGDLLFTFNDPTPADLSFFGRYLAIEGQLIAISSFFQNEVHLFNAISGQFIQTLNTPPSQSVFGRSIDINGGRILVGASNQSHLYSNAPNIPPIADAGPDQTGVLNNAVLFLGFGSTDPDGNILQYLWEIESAPAGSIAQLTNEDTVAAQLIPDVLGEYVISLTVTDASGGSDTDSMTLTAVTAESAALFLISETLSFIDSSGNGNFTTSGNKNALMNFLEQAINAINQGHIAIAVNKLEDALKRTDGCINNGVPDGNGPGKDWITSCSVQNSVYFPLFTALSYLTQ